MCSFRHWERAVFPASQIRWNGFNKPIQSEFHSFSLISQPLVNNILSHNCDYTEETVLEQQSSIKEVMKMKLNRHSTAATQLRAMLPSNLQLAMDLCQEKGVSSWLTVLPIEEYGLTFIRPPSRDALALRCGWLLANTPPAMPVVLPSLLSMPCHVQRWLPFHQAQWDQRLYCLCPVKNLPQCFSWASSTTITGEISTSASANFQDGARLDEQLMDSGGVLLSGHSLT